MIIRDECCGITYILFTETRPLYIGCTNCSKWKYPEREGVRKQSLRHNDKEKRTHSARKEKTKYRTRTVNENSQLKTKRKKRVKNEKKIPNEARDPLYIVMN